MLSESLGNASSYIEQNKLVVACSCRLRYGCAGGQGRITKLNEKTSGDNAEAHYFGCSVDFMGAYM